MTKRPFNILWLTMDHVTFHHYRHTAGARPVLNTYEALCREGISFSSCKSVHPLCMPARATMLTGVYPHRHGGINNDTIPASSRNSSALRAFIPPATAIPT